MASFGTLLPSAPCVQGWLTLTQLLHHSSHADKFVTIAVVSRRQCQDNVASFSLLWCTGWSHPTPLLGSTGGHTLLLPVSNFPSPMRDKNLLSWGYYSLSTPETSLRLPALNHMYHFKPFLSIRKRYFSVFRPQWWFSG